MVQCVHPGRNVCGTRGGRGASVCLRARYIFLQGLSAQAALGKVNQWGSTVKGLRYNCV